MKTDLNEVNKCINKVHKAVGNLFDSIDSDDVHKSSKHQSIFAENLGLTNLAYYLTRTQRNGLIPKLIAISANIAEYSRDLHRASAFDLPTDDPVDNTEAMAAVREKWYTKKGDK